MRDKPILTAGAMISFSFNCGRGVLEQYLLGRLRLEDSVHDHAGNIEPGLVRRRKLEAVLIALPKA